VLEILRRLAGGPVTAGSRLEADLGLDSLAVAELAATLRAEFGNRVDLAGYLAELEFEELIELTAGQVADFVARRAMTAEPRVNR
jgi:acyl carrier protein